jgi:hypothetical protein
LKGIKPKKKKKNQFPWELNEVILNNLRSGRVVRFEINFLLCFKETNFH